MVQTYQSPVRVYKFPFELVMAAYHKRFPTCPQIPIFVGSDITYEWKADDGGEEIVERKCQLNVEAPYLVKKIAGVDYVYFKQRNHLDMRKRTLLIEASNISFSSRIVVIENCRYYVHTENPEWTCFEQSASLDVKSFFGFETAVEKLAVKQYSANIAKGKEVLEFFIEDLLKNGVNNVPKWSPSAEGAEKSKETTGTVQTADGLTGGTEVAVKANGKPGNGEMMTTTNNELEKEIPVPDRMSPPSTPPASSSGFGSSTTTNATLANELMSAPLSGTAEEKLSMEELKRRRSSAAGGGAKQTGAAASGTPQGGVGGGQKGVMAGRDAAGRTKSFDDLESKLESEYIQRFLGQLTPLEESRLCELKYGIQSAHKGKIPNDAHLLRFLRARDFDVQKATKMVMNSLLWRKQHNVDKILHEFVTPPVLLKYFPGGWHHNDKNGRPMFILRLGQMDIKGLLRSVGLEAILKFTLSICEQGLLKTAEATNRLGKPISAWTLLVDLEGLSMRHLWRPGVQCLLHIINTLEAHYPECLGMVLITRAPRAFPILWTLVSPFIDENTRKKFELYASDQVLNELARYVPEEFLPDFLGGPCPFETAATKDGPPWMVPKTEYSVQGDELLRRENAEDILTSIYTSATVNRGSPYEICVWVQQSGSVLTWDFDILKGECEFLLYHTEKKIISKMATAGNLPASSAGGGPSSSSTTAAPLPGPLDRVVDTVTSEISNLLSSNPPPVPHFHAIAADPELRVGSELTIVERPLAFAETDSMQGSNYCAKPGTYILQFRHPSDSANAGADGQAAAQKKDSLAAEGGAKGGTTHKCRLMVYHELLNSADFRGSVASLESCRSSFNSLAAAGADSSLHSSKQNSPSNKRRQRIAQQQKEEEEGDDSEEQTPQAEELNNKGKEEKAKN